MKLWMMCMDCIQAEDSQSRKALFYVDLSEGPYYQANCPHGHQVEVVLTAPKFELLFDSGAMALLDGYPREAVSSFAAALERFYEHWLRAVLLHHGVPPDEWQAAWRSMAAQSERQLGAFISLYVREYCVAPQFLDSKWTMFRNDVIHKGKIPTRQHAQEYGDAVLQHMVGIYGRLYESHYKGLVQLHENDMAAARKSAPPSVDIGTMHHDTVFAYAAKRTVGSPVVTVPPGSNTPSDTPITFAAALNYFAGLRAVITQAIEKGPSTDA